jgi:hypothetical protein
MSARIGVAVQVHMDHLDRTSKRCRWPKIQHPPSSADRVPFAIISALTNGLIAAQQIDNEIVKGRLLNSGGADGVLAV